MSNYTARVPNSLLDQIEVCELREDNALHVFNVTIEDFIRTLAYFGGLRTRKDAR